MSSKIKKHDGYTFERAKQVFFTNTDEWTTWQVQSGMYDPENPPFVVDIFAHRGDYVIFLFGWENQMHFRQGWAVILTYDPWGWYRDIMEMVHDFYTQRKYYGHS